MAWDRLWRLRCHQTDLKAVENGEGMASLSVGINNNDHVNNNNNNNLGRLPRNSLNGARNAQRSCLKVWLIRLCGSILLWTCLIQLIALAQISWHPQLLLMKAWPSCFELKNDLHFNYNDDTNGDMKLPYSSSSSSSSYSRSSSSSSSRSSSSSLSSSSSSLSHSLFSNVQPPRARKYKSHGYLLISCNGGLNQMRAAICDMVAVARHLNLTMIVPELDKASFWADPSDFGDIFDVDHFIDSLRNEVRILKKLPTKYRENFVAGDIVSMPPISWSNESYYMEKILPLIKKQKVLHFIKTDARLANNGLPLAMQKLRCKVNFKALKFTPHIEELGQKIVRYLRGKGPFLVLHLRYEMDMLAFSGCTHGCTDTEADNLTKMRYAYPWWKEKVIDSEQKRLDGLCPLTPEETVLFLQALGIKHNTQIYIASGEIYGGQRRMAPLYAAYPNIARKETILDPHDLTFFLNHSSQMAAIDYLVSLESDVFLPTYDGNMAKVIEGHRRFLGFKKTVLPDRKKIVELVDHYSNSFLSWDAFSRSVKENHSLEMGAPRRRRMIPNGPKEEDYFYANPDECLT